jgi:histone H3/H4
MTDVSGTWRRCSSCKAEIPFGAAYWTCSVSTCNRKRTGLAFCTVSCWDAHLPVARHREAWAEEKTAPSSGETAGAGKRRIVRDTATPRSTANAKEVLVIASRLKEYVREKSGYNTSDRVLQPLSEIVRRVCDEAIRNAQREGRRTVLDRDIPDS